MDRHGLWELHQLRYFMNTFFAEGTRELVERLMPYHDFIAFRKGPILKVEAASAIPLHLGFVQEKLESGLFWTIFNSLRTPRERDDLFTD